MAGGFGESPLKVNAGLGQFDRWDEDAIKARPPKLAATALNVRPAPDLPSETLAAYRPMTSEIATYSIDDHPHLLRTNIRELF